MSWEVGSLLIVCLLLLAGFRWYERTKPSARMVALVATLAALGAVGRLAFAVFPNVKPTSDIVFCAGFALGGVPGFIVGSLAAFVSNMFFGHGWWTPWQMLAWGAVGIFGASLAVFYRKGCAAGESRIPSRMVLSLCCGFAGLMYGVIVDTGQWFAFSGDQRFSTLIATYISSFPWNMIHVVANISFCFLFGPVLLRALLRSRARLTVRWQPVLHTSRAAVRGQSLVVLVLAGTAITFAGGVRPAVAHADVRGAAVQYLQRAQNADGGFGGAPKQASTQMYTAWVVLGLAAAGQDPNTIRNNGVSPVDYLVKTVQSVNDLGGYERTIMALAAAGHSVKNVAGQNLVAKLVGLRSSDGSFSGQANLTAFAVLALRAAGRSASDRLVQRATKWLVKQQNTDGGFNFATQGGASGIDDTAAVLQAIVAGKGSTKAVQRAGRFLRSQQNLDGGFPLVQSGESNAQSAAWAAQAFAAAGVDAAHVQRDGSRSPLGYLTSLQDNNGSIRYSRSSTQTPVWVTAQALTALAKRPFPFRARGVSNPKNQQSGKTVWRGVSQVQTTGGSDFSNSQTRQRKRLAKAHARRRRFHRKTQKPSASARRSIESLLYQKLVDAGKIAAFLS